MKASFFILALALLPFSGCRKPDLSEIDNLNGGEIDIIGHGGSGFQELGESPVPINSEASILRAVEGYGVNGVEVDVQITADSILVLFHDEHLQNSTDCEGCIQNQSVAEVLQCRYNQTLGSNLIGDEHLVTLEWLIDRYTDAAYQPTLYLDLRGYDFCDDLGVDPGRLARTVANLIDQYDAYDWVVVESRSIAILQALRAESSELRTVFDVVATETAVAQALAVEAEGLAFSLSQVNEEVIEEAHDHDLYVLLFGVRSRLSALEAIELSPDGIQTDNIPMLQDLLDD